MTVGTALKITKDIITLLETEQILKADGTFDQTKLDTLAENAVFAVKVLAILKKYGVPYPADVEKFLAIAPLLIGLFD